MSYEPPSLAPLTITPQLQAQAQQAAAQNAPLPPIGGTGQPPPPPALAAAEPANDNVEALAAMFPDMDKGVLSVILSDCGNNVEDAVNQLLQMTGASGDDGNSAAAAAAAVADEELAQALMIQFRSTPHPTGAPPCCASPPHPRPPRWTPQWTPAPA